MSASQSGTFNVQEFTDLGVPLVGGRLYTYAYGTTTQKTAYTDHAGVVPHTYTSDGAGGQYIALNSRGELPAPLYLAAGSYDLALKTSAGATVWTRRADPVWDITSDLSTSIGASLIGYTPAGTGAVATTVQSKLRESVSVKDFGAVGDGVTDDTAAIQAAITASLVPSVGYKTVFFPTGIYRTSSPLLLPANYVLYGECATIKPLPGYVGQTVNISGGGTIVLDALLVFLLGDYNNIAGPLRERAYVGEGITLDCNNTLKSGIYIERMPYSHISCRVDNTIAGGNAIDFGPYSWGSHIDNTIVENFAENAIGIGAGCNGITITSPRIWGNTKTGVTGILVKNGANANGIVVNGGFIEKVAQATYVGTTNGPIVFNGTDFEVCTNVIKAIGDLTQPSGRKIGPITLKGCYLDASGSKVYADKAEVVVDGCRLRTGVDFEGSSTAFISSRDNVFENATPSIVAGTIISMDEERTWTPVLWDDTLSSSEGQTYTTAYGTYKRQGNEIHYKGHIAMSSIGTLTGAQTARIGGLPFTSSNVASSHSALNVGFASGLAMAAANAIGGYVGVGVAYINLAKFSTTTGSTNLTITEVSASGLLIFSGYYTV